jgi:hypothetical protein
MAYKMGKDLTKQPYYQNKNKNINIETKVNINNINSEENAYAIDTSLNSTNNCDSDDNNTASEKDYINVVKKVKKDNITPDNIGEIMLCQIPGISSVTALAVMEKYKTIPNLIKEIELNNDSMKDLSYTNSKGQVRKINKTCIANIVKFLLKK